MTLKDDAHILVGHGRFSKMTSFSTKNILGGPFTKKDMQSSKRQFLTAVAPGKLYGDVNSWAVTPRFAVRWRHMVL
jgi:hypothetical protein